jgi:hypothetical protein
MKKSSMRTFTFGVQKGIFSTLDPQLIQYFHENYSIIVMTIYNILGCQKENNLADIPNDRLFKDELELQFRKTC